MQVAIDLETTSLAQDATITTLALQWSDEDRALITGKENIENTIQRLADNETITDYIFQNAQFDLTYMGDYFRTKTYGRIRDTMLIAKARGELKVSLKHLGNLYTNRPGNYSWITNKKHNFDDPEYVTEDICVTWKLFKLWENEISKPIVELMDRAVVMCCEQSIKGSKVDTDKLETLAEDSAKQVIKLRKELTNKYGVDPNKQEELIEVLRTMGFSFSKKTAKGKDALTAVILEDYGLTDILDYRRACKIDSSFVGKIKSFLRDDGTVPHRQQVMGAITGRSTMNDLNWQQFPRKGIAKHLLISRFNNGKIFSVDLSQAELRVAAYLSNDEVMMEWLGSTDAHRENAAKALNKDPKDVTDDERYDAKTIVFRSIYGGQPITEGQKRVYNYLKTTFKKLFIWIERQKQIGMRDKRVTDIYGKTVNLLQIYDYKGKWACGRVGINAPVQGIASHIAFTLTVRLWELLKPFQSLVLFGIHDSILVDCHPDEIHKVIELTQQSFFDMRNTPIWTMIPAMQILPLLGEGQVGNNWGELKNNDKVIFSTLDT